MLFTRYTGERGEVPAERKQERSHVERGSERTLVHTADRGYFL